MTPNCETPASSRLWLAFATVLLVSGTANTFPVFLPPLGSGRRDRCGSHRHGLPLGSRATIVSVLVSRIAPPAHHGVIFGLLGIGNGLGAAAGPWLSGALYGWTSSCVVIYVAASAVALTGLAGLVLFCLTTSSVRAVERRPA